ncbi:Thiol:disulfide interchange protein DsbC [Vibrio stylophorae]|uniref:Thiol:disulfide interchange protein n=1 Tax=Vibrio stylophorae TaxID=659351 RepID=A0ABM8ZS03_9VIBR|nr:bifunctional protein-disulfide isomerase/oxidoreductase DsbC [Vibrio stylophorae]CAH0532676.1 Thiol:disulfide interchange protein DsbC [Vibrio stylophorae]
MLRRTLTGIALTLSFVLPAHADDAAIQTQFAKLGLNVESVQASPVAGLKLVATDQGIFYASDDGQYFIHGKMFKIGETGITDVAAAVVKKQLEALLPTAIVYKAPKEKYAITVFTDTSCGYCQKLHQELQDYLDAGITVRYLAYPRHGVDSQTGHLLSNIWCAKDPAQAMTDGKAGKAVAGDGKSCLDIIAKHYQFGAQVGVNGTPAVLLDDGTLLPGYRPANAMLQVLQSR